jgi:tellurite resistance protein TehA-like permease
MNKKNYMRLVLILAIFFLALGGWLLHLRIHPTTKDAENYIPLVAGFISVFVIPVLFIFRSTISFAYLLNGMTVIIGTITMTHFTIENPPAGMDSPDNLPGNSSG